MKAVPTPQLSIPNIIPQMNWALMCRPIKKKMVPEHKSIADYVLDLELFLNL